MLRATRLERGSFGERKVRHKVIFFFSALFLHIAYAILSQKQLKQEVQGERWPKLSALGILGKQSRCNQGLSKSPPTHSARTGKCCVPETCHSPLSFTERPESPRLQGLTVQPASEGECGGLSYGSSSRGIIRRQLCMWLPWLWCIKGAGRSHGTERRDDLGPLSRCLSSWVPDWLCFTLRSLFLSRQLSTGLLPSGVGTASSLRSRRWSGVLCTSPFHFPTPLQYVCLLNLLLNVPNWSGRSWSQNDTWGWMF